MLLSSCTWEDTRFTDIYLFINFLWVWSWICMACMCYYLLQNLCSQLCACLFHFICKIKFLDGSYKILYLIFFMFMVRSMLCLYLFWLWMVYVFSVTLRSVRYWFVWNAQILTFCIFCLILQEVDIWSYGCLLLELLTCKFPYEGKTESELYDLLQVNNFCAACLSVFLIFFNNIVFIL